MPGAPESLREELRAIEGEMAATRNQIAILHGREREALAEHDRLALDRAWADHDRQIERQRELEIRREQASHELAAQLAQEVDRWEELLAEWNAPAPPLHDVAERLAVLSERCRAWTNPARQ